jgi:hypothetical protein
MARRIDRLVESEVLKILQPPSRAALESVVREKSREYEALRRTRENDVRRAELAVHEAERDFDQSDAGQVYVRKRLADRLDLALKQLDEIRASHQLRPLIPPLSLSDSRFDELSSLLTELPRLWHHPQVIPEQRKAVVRLVVKAVHATHLPAAWTIEIEWISGARTAHQILNPTGVHSLVRQAAAAGLSVPDIVEDLRERGVVHPYGGKPYTQRHIRLLVEKMRAEPR